MARDTPSPQGILYLVLTVHSMLEAPNSLQQISKYSMKQPLRELYPELLTLCFSLLLFVCLWRYDYLSSSASFDPVSPLLYFPSSLAPLLVRLGTMPFSFTWGSLWVGKTGNINRQLNRSTSVDNTPREPELQYQIAVIEKPHWSNKRDGGFFISTLIRQL